MKIDVLLLNMMLLDTSIYVSKNYFSLYKTIKIKWKKAPENNEGLYIYFKKKYIPPWQGKGDFVVLFKDKKKQIEKNIKKKTKGPSFVAANC